MSPSHEQLTDATTRFVTRAQARIIVLQQKVGKTEERTRKARFAADPKVRLFVTRLCRALKLDPTNVRAVLDYDCKDFDLEFPDSTFTYVIKTFPSTASLVKPYREEHEQERDGKTVCNAIEQLQRLLQPSALNTWRSFVRAQWSPNNRTDKIPQPLLESLARDYQAAKAPLACSL